MNDIQLNYTRSSYNGVCPPLHSSSSLLHFIILHRPRLSSLPATVVFHVHPTYAPQSYHSSHPLCLSIPPILPNPSFSYFHLFNLSIHPIHPIHLSFHSSILSFLHLFIPPSFHSSILPIFPSSSSIHSPSYPLTHSACPHYTIHSFPPIKKLKMTHNPNSKQAIHAQPSSRQSFNVSFKNNFFNIKKLT